MEGAAVLSMEIHRYHRRRMLANQFRRKGGPGRLPHRTKPQAVGGRYGARGKQHQGYSICQRLARELFRTDIAPFSGPGAAEINGQEMTGQVPILAEQGVDHHSEIPGNPQGDVAHDQAIQDAEGVVCQEQQRLSRLQFLQVAEIALQGDATAGQGLLEKSL